MRQINLIVASAKVLPSLPPVLLSDFIGVGVSLSRPLPHFHAYWRHCCEHFVTMVRLGRLGRAIKKLKSQKNSVSVNRLHVTCINGYVFVLV